jgi:hypothetical protein
MMVLSYEQAIVGAKKCVLSKLERYLADSDYSDGQKLEMLYDIERNIDEAY